jgi:hypothetical protein
MGICRQLRSGSAFVTIFHEQRESSQSRSADAYLGKMFKIKDDWFSTPVGLFSGIDQGQHGTATEQLALSAGAASDICSDRR